MRSQMDRVRERELEQLMRRLGELGPTEREAIEHFSRALMNKFLHEPTVRLRAAASNGRGLGVVDAARYLFALADSSPESTTTSGGSPAVRSIADPPAETGSHDKEEG
jgi:glutamyl-tRNA reductase